MQFVAIPAQPDANRGFQSSPKNLILLELGLKFGNWRLVLVTVIDGGCDDYDDDDGHYDDDDGKDLFGLAPYRFPIFQYVRSFLFPI